MLLAAVVVQQPRGDRVGGLRLDARAAVGAVLHAELDVQQAQEMIDLGERRDGALAAAAAGALLDGHRRRNAEDGVHVGARGRLHELARIGVQRFEVAALALGEQDVEGQRALAAAGHAGDDGEALRARSTSMSFRLCSRAPRSRSRAGTRSSGSGRESAASATPLAADVARAAGLASFERAGRCASAAMPHDLLGRARRHQRAAGLAAFGAEIDDPVGGADHVEVVLDDEQRVAGRRSAGGRRAAASRCRRNAGRWWARRT